MLNEIFVVSHFIVMFVGVNLTFFPQHFLGLSGMPRRYRDYIDGYLGWNQVSRIGSLVSIFAAVMFFYVLWESIAVVRLPLFSLGPVTQVEWFGGYYPLDYHNLEGQVILCKGGDLRVFVV